jgi:hypothetical protein
LGSNLGELRQGEVRRSPLTRTPVDKERLCSLVQDTFASEVRFRAELSEYGVGRLELARA